MLHREDFSSDYIGSLSKQQLHLFTKVVANRDQGPVELSNTQWQCPDRKRPDSVENESGATEGLDDAHSVRGCKRHASQLDVDRDDDRDSKRPRHGTLQAVALKDALVPDQEGNAAESEWGVAAEGSGNATATIPVSPVSTMQISASTQTISDDHGELSVSSNSDDEEDDMLLVTPAVGSQAKFIVRSCSFDSGLFLNVADEGNETAIFVDLSSHWQEPEAKVTEPVAEEIEVEEDIGDPVVLLPTTFPRAVKGSQGQKWFRAVMRNVFELLLIEDDFERPTPDIAQLGSLIIFLFQICVTHGQPMEILEEAIETVASFARSRHFAVLVHLRPSTAPCEILKSMSVIALLLASNDLPEDRSSERFMDALVASMALEQEEFLFRRYVLAPHQPTETSVKVVPRTAVRLRELLLASSSNLPVTRLDLNTVRYKLAKVTGRTRSDAEVECKGLAELSDNFWLLALLVDLWDVGASPRMVNSALVGALFACRSLMVGGQARESELWPDVLIANTGVPYNEAKRRASWYLSQARGIGLEIKLPVQDKKKFARVVETVEKILQPVVRWV